MDTPPLVADPELVTPEWLTDVLRHGGAIDDATKVVSYDSASIGTGQVGANVRYTLQYEGEPGPSGRLSGKHPPGSIVCKFSSRDPQSATTGVQTLT